MWPWLLVLLGLVIGGVLLAVFLTRGNGHKRTTPATTVVVTTATTPTTLATQTVPEPVPTARVPVPTVVGLTEANAVAQLRRAGLEARVRRTHSSKPAGIVVSENPPARTRVKRGSAVALAVSLGPAKATVPDVTGKDQAEAVAALQSAGLKPVIVEVASQEPLGTVVGQDPAAGQTVPPGSRVRLQVAKVGPSTTQPPQTQTTPATTAAPAPTPTTPAPTTSSAAPALPPKVSVPGLVGKTLPAARRLLRNKGLVTEVHYVPSREPVGTVVAQQPKPLKTVRKGTHVLVNVSRGAKPGQQVAVPDVVGEDEQTAISDLEQAEFTEETIDQPTSDPSEDGVVIAQDPPGGARVPRHQTVQLYVGRLNAEPTQTTG
jgi:beta-lactam-binding protein with PASTA domain